MATNKISAAIVKQGLVIKDDKKFLKSVESQLGKAIGENYLRHTPREKGTRILYYVQPQQAVVVNGLPATILVEREEFVAWLVTEIEFERFPGQSQLMHVSLKLYAGPIVEAAKLYFRAEWDARENPRGHAQPHWNIHDIAWRGLTDEDDVVLNFDELVRLESPNFTDLIDQNAQRAEPKKAPAGSLLTNMQKFHFAMAAQWFDKNNIHTFIVDDEDKLRHWIAGCAAYIKAQMSHLKL